MAPALQSLKRFLDRFESLAVLSGAGVSTGSGIPDYRDREGKWKHTQPIQYGDFMKCRQSRQRYWARSYAGWQRFSRARPNAAHHALARLEAAGKIDTVITQNVDRLHSSAGNQNVIDLHGDLARVKCMNCGVVTQRKAFQSALERFNPDWTASVSQYRADGDAELAHGSAATFKVPGCATCDGIVKPDVVMFGENVPRERVAAAMDAVQRADALLVVGSSLMVFSGFRFARHASELGKPVAIVNRGRTRADGLADLKIEEDCASVLPIAIDSVTAR
jgi:NAD-dependent SIR2 family protein deacetylase